MAADLAFDALADPVRREILAVLAERDECSAGELSGAIAGSGVPRCPVTCGSCAWPG